MEVVGVAENWMEAERSLIGVLRAKGVALLNVAPGGNQPYCPLETAKENGRALARKLSSDRSLERVRSLNQAISGGLKSGLISNSARAKLRRAAAIRPDLFGKWATLPDAMEASNASRV